LYFAVKQLHHFNLQGISVYIAIAIGQVYLAITVAFIILSSLEDHGRELYCIIMYILFVICNSKLYESQFMSQHNALKVSTIYKSAILSCLQDQARVLYFADKQLHVFNLQGLSVDIAIALIGIDVAIKRCTPPSL